ncbi:MAG: hypothetical protein KJ558_11870 [Gammaproteobacteria bacterium]|nr:hypothetical protein [Gammaproteobacteria bacterium]MBU1655501.1 hypothetical protein [Gammaproteobacteria bacterium]MBU1960824.1 hypothetical protein [Gammaproteobacteria bacterium]
MRIVASYSEVVTHSHVGAPFDWDEGPFWELGRCSACGGIVLRKGYWHEYLPEDSGPEYKWLYPARPRKLIGLPKAIANAYSAAIKVKPIDSIAFGVLLGRVFDLVCIDQQAEGGGFLERLQDIAAKGIIPPRLVEMVAGVRILGEMGPQADLGRLTTAEIPILEGLVNAVLEYTYAASVMVAIVQKRLDEIRPKQGQAAR